MNPSLTVPPPILGLDHAAILAAQHFGLTGTLTQLTSERDLNFRLTTPDASYVLKLANPAEPPEVTNFQTQALLHLATTNLPVPRIRRSLTGATEVTTDHGILRLLTYLHGQPQHLTAKTPGQRRNLGTMAARLTLGLQGFSHPAAAHVLQWDIKHAAALRPLLLAIPPDLHMIARQTLDRFDALRPALTQCRTQVVHNDLNPHNVLVNPDNPDQIAGILDFGDMVATPLVCDAAVAACSQIDPDNPLESLMDFATAYHKTLPLTAQEARLLPDLVATRMLTSLAIASARVAKFPENAAYILRNFHGAQAGLTALAALDRAQVQRAMETL